MNKLLEVVSNKTDNSDLIELLAPYKVADSIDKIAGKERTVIVLDLDDLDHNNIPSADRFRSYFPDSLVASYRKLGFQAYVMPLYLEEQAA